jgi:hypothetical protein
VYSAIVKIQGGLYEKHTRLSPGPSEGMERRGETKEGQGLKPAIV